MPRLLQLLTTYHIPARYFLVIVQGMFLKGARPAVLWDQVLPITLLGPVLFMLSTRSFKMQIV